MNNKQETYSYGPQFQRRVLSLLVQEETFHARYQGVIRPQYFEHPHHQSLCRMVLGYIEKYQQPPKKGDLKVMVEDALAKTPAGEDEVESILTVVEDIYDREIGKANFVIDKVVQFGQRQALIGAVGEIVEILEQDAENYDEVRTKMEKALQVGCTNLIGDFLEDDLPTLDEKARQSRQYDDTHRIGTGWAKLDEIIKGIAPGEFGVVVGSKGKGKSTFLANIGYAAASRGYRVLHITLELKQLDIELKYAARHTGININDIVWRGKEYRETIFKMPPFSPDGEKRIHIKYFSPGTLTASSVRSYLAFLASACNWRPDLLIIDYLKQMKCERDHNGYGRLVDDIIAVCDDYSVGCWTAHQGNRSTFQSDEVTADLIGDSWQIIEKADLGLAISQTSDERMSEPPVFRISIECSRRSSDGQRGLGFSINYKNCRVMALDEDFAPKRPMERPGDKYKKSGHGTKKRTGDKMGVTAPPAAVKAVIDDGEPDKKEAFKPEFKPQPSKSGKPVFCKRPRDVEASL
jgi:replicative DNA helicase